MKPSPEALRRERDTEYDGPIAKLNLMVREHNHAVAAFYEKLGFGRTPRINLQKSLKP